MKKRITTFLLAMLCAVTGIFAVNVEAKAETLREEDVELSYLMTEDAIIGYMERQTWGVYLSSGYSIINNAGVGKIGAGGITNAATRCKVSVNAVVERKEGSNWVRVTSWTQTNQNALTASVSKYLYVTSGYYYRVRSTHSAATDTSSSYTNSLWM